MENNLDQQFKDAFENYEMPFNAAAWDAMNARLDSLPTKSKPNSGLGKGKMLFIGVVCISAAIGSYLLLHGLSPKVEKVENISLTNKQYSAKTNNSTASKGESLVLVETNEKQNSPEKFIKAKLNDNPIPIPSNSNTFKYATGSEVNYEKEEKFDYANLPIVKVETEKKNDQIETNFSFPNFTNICLNTETELVNKNTSNLVVINPKGSKTSIKAGSVINYRFDLVGVYTLIAEDNPTLSKTFVVASGSSADIHITELFAYENGLPTTTVYATGTPQSFTWKLDGAPVKSNKHEVRLNIFQRGSHKIELITNDNECKNHISKDIYIEEQYNLLAPSAFVPTSNDPRNRTFLPLALRMRDAEFKMIIIDPKSGATIFETSSYEGWDGIDKTTNQLVPINGSFLWRVFLLNPEHGENKEYSGIITRL